jgi:hypothetical protein
MFICNLLVAYQQTMPDSYMQPYGCSFRESSDDVGIFGEGLGRPPGQARANAQTQSSTLP